MAKDVHEQMQLWSVECHCWVGHYTYKPPKCVNIDVRICSLSSCLSKKLTDSVILVPSECSEA